MLAELQEKATQFEDLLLTGKLEKATALLSQFPTGKRKSRLEAMIHEARKEWDQAVAIYDADPSPEAKKQKAMCLYGKGDTEGAVAVLIDYLDSWMGTIHRISDLF
jgi:thioredoxin-like negative regulator of GroEL